jgi:hypothetical protein
MTNEPYKQQEDPQKKNPMDQPQRAGEQQEPGRRQQEQPNR